MSPGEMCASPRLVRVLAAALTVVFVLSGWAEEGLGPFRPVRDTVLVVANTAPVLLVSANPLLGLLVSSAMYPVWIAVGHTGQMFQSLPALTLMFATGTWDRPLRVRAPALLAPVWMLSICLTGTMGDPDLLQLGFVGAVFVQVWVLGVALGDRSRYARQLEARTVALEQARRELAERAVADERARIARELHDIVGHAMSVITVRAGIGAHLIGTRPAEAATALRVIEGTGRQAMAEMRRMLGLLRDPGPRVPRPEPQPGLGDLADLVDRAGQAGVAASLAVEGPVARLPPGLDLAAYRVVQEALTNAGRHAPGTRVAVAVRYGPGQVEVEVRNPVPAGSGTPRRCPQDPPARPGHGLRGMAERVALYDGTLDAGPDGDAFRVLARFPREEEG